MNERRNARVATSSSGPPAPAVFNAKESERQTDSPAGPDEETTAEDRERKNSKEEWVVFMFKVSDKSKYNLDSTSPVLFFNLNSLICNV